MSEVKASVQKANPTAESHTFQTEVKHLLHLMTHALYSKKEIFLRELISNASDASDRLRLMNPGAKLDIKVAFDKDAKTITISDQGIGMNKDQAISHLGTIAKSGTREFLQSLTGDDAKDERLIGQFGVGFYSAFIVADKVEVLSRAHDAKETEAIRWVSDGQGAYDIERAEKSSVGTDIILHLKSGEEEFLDRERLKNIITTYSDHISFPIIMDKVVETPVSEEKTGEEAKNEEKPVETVTTIEPETVNRAKALWTLPRSEISDEDYQAFYKHISHDFELPLAWTHNQVEGKQAYTYLLFIPKRPPFDLFNRDHKHGLKLFIKRVYIMDDAEQFLPNYLRFVKGVIDSNDLSLNISREILQSDPMVKTIRSGLVRKTLDLLARMAKEETEKYTEFYQAFGEVLKEGPAEDFANRDKIAPLLRFASTHNEDPKQYVSLADYVSRMPSTQKKIYYITAESLEAAKASPHLEVFRKKGVEVLLLFHRVDEWLVQHLGEFEGKALQSVAKGALDLDAEDEEAQKKAQETLDEAHKDFISRVKAILEARVSEVRMSQRLTTSPSCVVANEHDLGRQMQLLLKAHGQNFPTSKPILELNPEHVIVKQLENEPDEERFKDWSHLLLDQAILAEGGQLDAPAEFVKRFNQIWSEKA